jgi:hypothetical protein
MLFVKRRALGSAFFLFLVACSEPPSPAAESLLRRYAVAECLQPDSIVRNVHIETIDSGSIRISDAATGRRAFIHASPTEMRITLGGLNLFIREKTTLTEYRLNPVQFQTRIELGQELPPTCRTASR